MSPDTHDLSREELALCAHDLRGVLTVIAGYASLLRRDDLASEDRMAAFDGIDAAIARADALVGDTLAGRGGSRSGELVALDALVEQASADARVATGRDVRASVTSPAVVRADPLALSRVLENLLSNAAKYAPDGPIDVTLELAGEVAVLEVADRGPGIPQEERTAVFEPFFRLDRDAEKPGHGLGLVVVREAMARMGGRAEVRSREGGGAVIRLEIPRSA